MADNFEDIIAGVEVSPEAAALAEMGASIDHVHAAMDACLKQAVLANFCATRDNDMLAAQVSSGIKAILCGLTYNEVTHVLALALQQIIANAVVTKHDGDPESFFRATFGDRIGIYEDYVATDGVACLRCGSHDCDYDCE